MIRSILLSLALVLAIGSTGCVSTGDLEPGGVYDSSAVVYNAETTINTSYLLMDNFLKWEFENRAAFADVPEVKAAADYIRGNGEQWISSAIALTEAYKINPTDENRTALDSALSVISTALMEATKYMTLTP